MKYSSEQLNEMASKINIVDYIGQTETLHRRGDKYFINCPFHSGDNTPSLCLYPNSNKWYCFGCGEGSSIYDWMIKYENLSFNEAVEKVASLTGSEIEEIVESESISTLKEISKQCETKEETTQQRVILDWKKDYEDEYSDELPEEWLAEDMTAEALKKYNIRIDHNSNRIVYPVMDADGNFIGVKGRTRISAYKELGLSKYMNYNKIGTIDYFQGWQQAFSEIINRKSVIIFEGIKSCIKAYGWGVANTVASETSALSDGQLKLLLKTGISEVIIAWDSDQKFGNIINDSKIKMLKIFTKVSVIHDTENLLGEKEAPVDRGEEVFKRLLEKRFKI